MPTGLQPNHPQSDRTGNCDPIPRTESYAVAMHETDKTPDFGSLDSSLQHAAVDHVAMAVENLEEATEPYLLLGFEPGTPELVAEQGVRVRMIEATGARIELLEPTGPETPVGRFLAKRGPGLHHVGLSVEALEPTVEKLRRAGARLIDSEPRVGHGGSRVVFLHPSWANGVLLELVEHNSSRHG